MRIVFIKKDRQVFPRRSLKKLSFCYPLKINKGRVNKATIVIYRSRIQKRCMTRSITSYAAKLGLPQGRVTQFSTTIPSIR
jgi:hypothetical protein